MGGATQPARALPLNPDAKSSTSTLAGTSIGTWPCTIRSSLSGVCRLLVEERSPEKVQKNAVAKPEEGATEFSVTSPTVAPVSDEPSIPLQQLREAMSAGMLVAQEASETLDRNRGTDLAPESVKKWLAATGTTTKGDAIVRIEEEPSGAGVLIGEPETELSGDGRQGIEPDGRSSSDREAGDEDGPVPAGAT